MFGRRGGSPRERFDSQQEGFSHASDDFDSPYHGHRFTNGRRRARRSSIGVGSCLTGVATIVQALLVLTACGVIVYRASKWKTPRELSGCWGATPKRWIDKVDRRMKSIIPNQPRARQITSAALRNFERGSLLSNGALFLHFSAPTPSDMIAVAKDIAFVRNGLTKESVCKQAHPGGDGQSAPSCSIGGGLVNLTREALEAIHAPPSLNASVMQLREIADRVERQSLACPNSVYIFDIPNFAAERPIEEQRALAELVWETAELVDQTVAQLCADRGIRPYSVFGIVLLLSDVGQGDLHRLKSGSDVRQYDTFGIVRNAARKIWPVWMEEEYRRHKHDGDGESSSSSSSQRRMDHILVPFQGDVEIESHHHHGQSSWENQSPQSEL